MYNIYFKYIHVYIYNLKNIWTDDFYLQKK